MTRIIYIAMNMMISSIVLQMSGANANIGFWDVVDVLIVAYLLYTLYKLLKGTVAFNIFIGVVLLYVLWWTVSAMNMQILSTILDQFVNVGVIVVVIVFQPEIRRFLLMVGSTAFKSRLEQLENFFKSGLKFESKTPKWVEDLKTCMGYLKEKNLTSLLVITDNLNHESFISSGVRINGSLSKELFESLSLQNSPVQDGAMVIHDGRLVSAGCSLPVAGKQKMRYSLKERAALGISEQSNALVILITPGDRYQYSVAGELYEAETLDQLMEAMENHLKTTFAL